MSGFKNSSERLKDLKEFQDSIKDPRVFNNKFLDDALCGIYPDDLILVTAATGGGKTEFVTNILQANISQGKKVHLFALESHKQEIEMRIKFKLLAQSFFTQKDWRSYNDRPNYMSWFYGKQKEMLSKFEPEVDEILSKTLKPSNTYYLDGEFNVETFESQMHQIAEVTDLIILDHLHYFDFDGKNENSDMKRTVKQIRRITGFYRKPTIMVVHLRKRDKRVSGILPEIDDIHGSSDIAKIANKIIATAPAWDQHAPAPHLFPTYFKVLKCRLDGSRCRFVGLSCYDAQKNQFGEQYKIGEINHKTGDFILIDESQYPFWSSQKTRQMAFL